MKRKTVGGRFRILSVLVSKSKQVTLKGSWMLHRPYTILDSFVNNLSIYFFFNNNGETILYEIDN